MAEKKKYRCEVHQSAEEESYGIIYLTKAQYDAVKYVTDTDNWEDKSIAMWSGSFWVYCKELEKD